MLSFKLKLKEDTVSADRKEQIVFDPDAWSKKDRSGKKISSIVSRQNFDNEKFTRRKNKGDAELEEEIQTSGSSGYDIGSTPSSNTVQPAYPIKKKKTNNSEIEFVTGTAQPNGSSSTAQGNQPMTGRKLAEALVKKAMKKVKTCSEGVEKEDLPFDPDPPRKPQHNSDGTPTSPMSKARQLAQKALQKKAAKSTHCEEVEQIDELSKNTLGSYIKKATVSNRNASMGHANSWQSGDDAERTKTAKTMDKREKGIGSAVNRLAEAQYAGLEKEDKPGKVKTAAESPHKNGVNIDTVEGFKDEQKPTAPKTKKTNFGEGWDPEQFGSDGSGAGGAGAGDISTKDKKKKKVKLGEGMKTYSQFIDQLLEYTPGPNGRTVVKGNSYGAQYHDPEGDDDAWEKEGTVKMKPVAQEKRGRGRPSGSYGTYKARSAETKAAAAAKSAATKAANKAK